MYQREQAHGGASRNQQCVPIRGGACNQVRANDRSATGLGFDNEVLPQRSGQMLRDCSGRGIDASARGIGDDYAYWTFRVCIGMGKESGHQGQGCQCAPE
jgi:hypothetical protein